MLDRGRSSASAACSVSVRAETRTSVRATALSDQIVYAKVSEDATIALRRPITAAAEPTI
jgi:hypothetical protein